MPAEATVDVDAVELAVGPTTVLLDVVEVAELVELVEAVDVVEAVEVVDPPLVATEPDELVDEVDVLVVVVDVEPLVVAPPVLPPVADQNAPCDGL